MAWQWRHLQLAGLKVRDSLRLSMDEEGTATVGESLCCWRRRQAAFPTTNAMLLSLDVFFFFLAFLNCRMPLPWPPGQTDGRDGPFVGRG